MEINLRCLIIDDEPLAIDVIENYLQRLQVADIQRCENAMEAFQWLQKASFDLIFLDIEMPLLTGLDLLKTITNPPMVIITTAYRDYAVEGFEFEVLDYLVKPVSFPRFMKAMERALKNNSKSITEQSRLPEDNNFLFLKVDRKFVKINFSDILYIESLKDYIRVKTTDAAWVSYQSLASITEKLPKEKFMRIHRSFTIAVDKVNAIDAGVVEIQGKHIPISREHKQEALKRICR
jgi:DNA-binding LytR/AlgR family response regulator